MSAAVLFLALLVGSPAKAFAVPCPTIVVYAAVEGNVDELPTLTTYAIRRADGHFVPCDRMRFEVVPVGAARPAFHVAIAFVRSMVVQLELRGGVWCAVAVDCP